MARNGTLFASPVFKDGKLPTAASEEERLNEYALALALALGKRFEGPSL